MPSRIHKKTVPLLWVACAFVASVVALMVIGDIVSRNSPEPLAPLPPSLFVDDNDTLD